MSRSVSVPRNAAHVSYQTFQSDDDDAQDDFQWRLDDLERSLHQTFPTVTKDDRWLDGEDHVIASNRFAYFTVSEYCGLVSVCVVPRDDDYASAGWYALRDRWIDSIEDSFAKAVSGVFGVGLRKLGAASNGEAFFQPVDGKQRGEMGLGFTSKEGWL